MSKGVYKSDVSRRVQRAVADVLSRILLCEDEDEVMKVITESIDDYMLKWDPISGLPCSVYDYQCSLLKCREMFKSPDCCDRYCNCGSCDNFDCDFNLPF